VADATAAVFDPNGTVDVVVTVAFDDFKAGVATCSATIAARSA
jgi:hypothetical protein